MHVMIMIPLIEATPMSAAATKAACSEPIQKAVFTSTLDFKYDGT